MSPQDHIPEFQAQTLPAGTAPKSNTFQPDVTPNDPQQNQYSASSTIGGATSADVHTGYGHPGNQQTGIEKAHEGKHTSKREGAGLEGVGTGEGLDSKQAKDLQSDHTQTGPANVRGGTLAGAEEAIPATAEDVAAERD